MKFFCAVIGAWQYLRLPKQFKDPIKGICLSNINDTELSNSDVFGAKIMRLSEDHAVEYGQSAPKAYWVIVGKPSDSIGDIANKILYIDRSVKIKPRFYAVINEDNENTFQKVQAVREAILEIEKEFDTPVVKGPHTACTENAGFNAYVDYFSGKRDFNPSEGTHILHFYLKPWNASNKAVNTYRMYLLTYLVNGLKKLGAKNIIIAECHDGSRTKEGFEDQGDFAYASKEGFNQIFSLAGKLGISLVQYYASPYLAYRGNTVI